MSSTHNDRYNISTTSTYSLPDSQYHYHMYHYKVGKNKFDAWVKGVQGYARETISLNYYSTMAKKFVDKQGKIPSEPLYWLQTWLAARQVCYCHHMMKGDDNDEHLHAIKVVLELIRIFRPEDSVDMIAGCTPVNLHTLVASYGSEKAKELYALPQSPARRQTSPTRATGELPEYFSVLSEWEQKRGRMSQQSWRQPSTGSESLSRGRTSVWSTSTAASSSTSLSSQESQRAKSASPLRAEAQKSYASAANAWTRQQESDDVEKTSDSPRSGKLTLMTKAARKSLHWRSG